MTRMKSFHFLVGLILGAIITTNVAQKVGVCGKNQAYDLECKRQTFPDEYYYSHAVARVLTTNKDQQCSSFRVGTNLMMTSNLCIGSQGDVEQSVLQFNSKLANCNKNNNNNHEQNLNSHSDCENFPSSELSYYNQTEEKEEQTDPIIIKGHKLIATNATLDYTLFNISDDDANKLDQWVGPNNETIPILEIESSSPVQDQAIYIPQHDATGKLKLSIKDNHKVPSGKDCVFKEEFVLRNTKKTMIGYSCNTIHGSSGSPVIDRKTNKVIAIHAFGGCLNTDNGGYEMYHINPQIQNDFASTSTSSPSLTCVQLYRQAYYKGQKDEICLGDNTSSFASRLSSTQYSSIKIGPDVHAKLYKDADHNTQIRVVGNNIENFEKNDINSMISSIQIELKVPIQDYYCIILYRNANYEGLNDKFCYGNDVASVKNAFLDHSVQCSSVKVGSKVKAELFKDANFVNIVASLDSDQSDFRLNCDTVSSIKIRLRQ